MAFSSVLARSSCNPVLHTLTIELPTADCSWINGRRKKKSFKQSYKLIAQNVSFRVWRWHRDKWAVASGQWTADCGRYRWIHKYGQIYMLCPAYRCPYRAYRFSSTRSILLPTCRVEFPSVFDLLASNKAIKINLTVIKLAIGSW